MTYCPFNISNRMRLSLWQLTKIGFCLTSLLFPLAACSKTAPILELDAASTYSHDKNHFTQGLIFDDNRIIETTGLNGKSHLYQYSLGKSPQKKLSLAHQYFGEGLTKIDSFYYWITWKAGAAFVIDSETFEITDQFNYQGQGWGLATNGTELIMSNGSHKLYFRSPKDFAIKREIEVLDGAEPVVKLNELEWINGYIYANIWYSDDIVKIDPQTGKVVLRLSLKELRRRYGIAQQHVLNGIAYNQATGKTALTGKNWPITLYLTLP